MQEDDALMFRGIVSSCEAGVTVGDMGLRPEQSISVTSRAEVERRSSPIGRSSSLSQVDNSSTCGSPIPPGDRQSMVRSVSMNGMVRCVSVSSMGSCASQDSACGSPDRVPSSSRSKEAISLAIQEAKMSLSELILDPRNTSKAGYFTGKPSPADKRRSTFVNDAVRRARSLSCPWESNLEMPAKDLTAAPEEREAAEGVGEIKKKMQSMESSRRLQLCVTREAEKHKQQQKEASSPGPRDLASSSASWPQAQHPTLSISEESLDRLGLRRTRSVSNLDSMHRTNSADSSTSCTALNSPFSSIPVPVRRRASQEEELGS
eukprot:CAMPEP_0114166746 /NCGR_PEP_ID=MMETSP0043_2-20121206/32005_1 /TAXON_ID=464988 /ORGANISM="Hemiselmis andersenii, Strain CCMP644" /LENGTH=318 /DNA_ID=CAMNT_0001263773 /DNA_START=12 /DNA_END=965 /DNA_ORIENTATION=+